MFAASLIDLCCLFQINGTPSLAMICPWLHFDCSNQTAAEWQRLKSTLIWFICIEATREQTTFIIYQLIYLFYPINNLYLAVQLNSKDKTVWNPMNNEGCRRWTRIHKLGCKQLLTVPRCSQSQRASRRPTVISRCIKLWLTLHVFTSLFCFVLLSLSNGRNYVKRATFQCAI